MAGNPLDTPTEFIRFRRGDIVEDQGWFRARLEDPIGSGAVGEVWKAVRLEAADIGFAEREPVAIKFLKDNAPRARRLFHEEFDHLMGLQDAPNVVSAKAKGEIQKHLWIAMGYASGVSSYDGRPGGPFRTLQELMEFRRGELSEKEAITVLFHLMEGVQAIHARKIIHLDLKPSNLLLTGSDNPGEPFRVLVGDFSISLREGTNISHHGGARGNTEYSAPEALEGRVREIGPASDVYSIGKLISYCLTGSSIPPSQASGDGLPPMLQEVVLKAVSPAPDHRYQTVAELKEAFAAYLTKKNVGVGKVEETKGHPTSSGVWPAMPPLNKNLCRVNVIRQQSDAPAGLVSFLSEKSFTLTKIDISGFGLVPFRVLPPLEFQVYDSECGRGLHVLLDYELMMMENPVSPEFWSAVMDSPSSLGPFAHAVTNVSAREILGARGDEDSFLARLREWNPGCCFRLPHESEWLLAAQQGMIREDGVRRNNDPRLEWLYEFCILDRTASFVREGELRPLACRRPTEWVCQGFADGASRIRVLETTKAQDITFRLVLARDLHRFPRILSGDHF